MKTAITALIATLVHMPFCGIGQEVRGAATCLDKEYHNNCFFAAKSIFDDYVYLKSRPFSRRMENLRFSLNLRKNTLYLFNICEGEDSKAVINLYADDGSGELLASTYRDSDRKHMRILSYYSQSNGTYQLSVSFATADVDCCVVVCGMIRKNIRTYVKLPAEP